MLSSAGRETYRFGAFELDAVDRRLSRGGVTVALMPKAFEVLLALIRNAGKLVTKQELLDTVWPDCYVEEGILAVHISGLRKVLTASAGGSECIETAQRLGYRFVAPVTPRSPAPAVSSPRCSLAVLPALWEDGAGSTSDQAFALTLADSLVTRLSACGRIIVRPINAVFRSAAGLKAPVAVARALCADAVVRMAFVRAEDRIEVRAELVRSLDGSCLWCRSYTEPPAGVMLIPEAIANSVLAVMLGRPPRPHRTGGSGRASRPAEVYEHFGHGRARLLSASREAVPRAIESFREAITIDPAYAPAHAGLALAFCAEAELRIGAQDKAFAAARASALRALDLDGDCADAHVALAAVQLSGDWDWSAAEASLNRALHLNPNHTEAYLLYGRLLEAVGAVREGLEMKLKALERDPLSPGVHLQIALSYWHLRSFDEMIEWAEKTLRLDPSHTLALEHLAGAWLRKGDDRRYSETLLRHAEACGAPAEMTDRMRRLAESGGRMALFRFGCEMLSRQPAPPAVASAILHGELAELDQAFACLERAIDERDPCLIHLAVGPQWDPLRADARFEPMLARIGLPPPTFRSS
jgi:DNA-binding winged helix-turn-helix (wHTH) protein/tetratricopeptide (TPR) repeat protein